MTRDEFVAAVAALGLRWRETALGKTRCARGDCPIVALARARGAPYARNWDYGPAGQFLGLSFGDAHAIADAADGRGDFALRERLRAALGVQ